MAWEREHLRCTVRGCTEPHYARGQCRLHYRRTRYGKAGRERPRKQIVCRVPGCDRRIASHDSGLCMTHYQRERRRRLAHVDP